MAKKTYKHKLIYWRERRRKMLILSESGWSLSEIGRRFDGISPEAVRLLLIKAKTEKT